jgi:hypothetical protein
VSLLLILKLTLTPVLVALVSLAARRFGPTIGGIMMGLPWMTGPVLFFLGLEHGEAYLAESARGALLAVPAIGAYSWAYAAVARHAGWLPSLAAGIVAFTVTGALLGGVSASATVVALLAMVALLATRRLIATPRVPLAGLSLPWWDIPARMVATAVLVGAIAVVSGYVGPTLVGIVSSYPVIMTVVTTFTHHRWGVDAVLALLRGIMLSLIGFVVFFWLVAMLAAPIGLVLAYVVASVAGVAFSTALLWGSRWSARSARAKVA